MYCVCQPLGPPACGPGVGRAGAVHRPGRQLPLGSPSTTLAMEAKTVTESRPKLSGRNALTETRKTESTRKEQWTAAGQLCWRAAPPLSVAVEASRRDPARTPHAV